MLNKFRKTRQIAQIINKRYIFAQNSNKKIHTHKLNKQKDNNHTLKTQNYVNIKI